ncbi:MAG: electron transport complex subunit RsxC [Lachnospiraceae bacterium]|nr:electron transport complex subunit RsxC [Lachnospiraceae bacterium]
MITKTFRGGVHPEGHKELSLGKPVETYLPKGDLVFPINQHIGKPAKPVVAKGDQVLAGQIIAEADGFVSANIVSSVSGKVKAIEPRVTMSGAKATCIVIENDGQYTLAPGVGERRSFDSVSNDEILNAVKAAGIVGMGGAGFPTHVKLMPKNDDAIEYIIANGSECEPYITCDDRLMQDHNRGIVRGLKLVLQLFPNAVGVVAIEDNKPEAIKSMEEICNSEKNITVQPVKAKYPEGGERNLISVITGRDLRAGQLPADVGCIVCNVASLYAIYNAVAKTEPLMDRYFTISGDAVREPKTVKAKIGTLASELVEAAGGFKTEEGAKKALCGGPMMGIAMTSLDAPITKNTNALTLFTEDPVEKAQLEMTSCIRCGRCVQACPIGLYPQMMAFFAERDNFAQYEKIYGLDCIQCGSCTYVCPAKRPLMQLFKQTKAVIMANKRKK